MMIALIPTGARDFNLHLGPKMVKVTSFDTLNGIMSHIIRNKFKIEDMQDDETQMLEIQIKDGIE